MRSTRLWLLLLVRPAHGLDEVAGQPAPWWGLRAVLFRFVGTGLTTMPLALLLGRKPFAPPMLAFLHSESYGLAQILILPVFGLAAWLLMGASAHLVLSLAAGKRDCARVLNIVAAGMLAPLPVIWLWDWAMLALDCYRLLPMALSHALFQVWEAGVQAMGLRRAFGLCPLTAIGLAAGINAIFVLLAIVVVR